MVEQSLVSMALDCKNRELINFNLTLNSHKVNNQQSWKNYYNFPSASLFPILGFHAMSSKLKKEELSTLLRF